MLRDSVPCHPWKLVAFLLCGALPTTCSPYDWLGGFMAMFDAAPPSSPSASTSAGPQRPPADGATARQSQQEWDARRWADAGASAARSRRSLRRLQSAPGAPWTQQEQDVIGEQLRQLFESSRGEFESRYCRLLGDREYPCHLELFHPNVIEPNCTSEKMTRPASPPWIKCDEPNVSKRLPKGAIPSVAKFLRLGFHDCIGYKDGTGGCDGCLNFRKAFVVKNIDERNVDPTKPTRRKADLPYDLTVDSNANLAATADMLEPFYKWRFNGLAQSLQESGKSRADLWAFATLRAIKWFTDRNNIFCQGETAGRWHPYADMFRSEMGIDFPCEISGLRDLHFYTGRRDCLEEDKPEPALRYRDYETTREEVMPNPHGNGKETLYWFEQVFSLNGREVVAAMGAHSVGTYTSTNHLFRYTWMGMNLRNDDMLNNLYYRLLAYRPMYTGSDLEKVANAKMNGESVPPASATQWDMLPRCITPSGGPIQWHLRMVRSANHSLKLKHGRTHTAFLNPDMGLYLDFATTAGGHPIRKNSTHCASLPSEGQAICKSFEVSKFAAVADCKQTADGGFGQPTWKIVEEYADNQELWYSDFTLAMEKILNNSYDDLTLSGTLPLIQVGVTPPAQSCSRKWCCNGLISGAACCAGTCNFCGGNGCASQIGGKEGCCVRTIHTANRECDGKYDTACLKPGTAKPTTTTTSTPVHPNCTEGWCCSGIEKDGVCCAASCGSCGGTGCKYRDGGQANCCIQFIKDLNRECNGPSDEGCMEPGTGTPATTTTTTTTTCPRKWCCTGVTSKSVCCAASCGSCGGSGCHKRPGGASKCCTRDIKNAGVVCANNTQEVCFKP